MSRIKVTVKLALAVGALWAGLGIAAALDLPSLPAPGMPSIPTPGLPGVGGVGGIARDTVGRATGTVGRATRLPSPNVPRDGIGRPIQPEAYETDRLGVRIMRGEIIAISPSAASLRTARSLNFSIGRTRNLDRLGLKVVVLRAPRGMSARNALKRLRALDPAGRYDVNHLFDPAGGTGTSIAAASVASGAIRGDGKRIGLVDGGIDESHPAFKSARLAMMNAVANEPPLVTAHGTALASLLVGESQGFTGAFPGATLYAADVFGGEERGGAADSVARGLEWLAQKQVPVIAMSLAGPENLLIKAAIEAMVARGFIIVAAAGNDGPAAPPVYPGAYPGVIAVTSVDDRRKLQLDAGRGPHIAFASLGVDVKAAKVGGDYATITGTSYAVPKVSAHFAAAMDGPDPTAAARVLESVKSEAIDLGDPGRDDSYGYGYLDGATPTASLTP